MKFVRTGAAIAILSIASCNDGAPPPSPRPQKTSEAANKIKPRADKHPPVSLDRLISFSDPSLCELNEGASRLMQGLHKLNGEQPISLGKVVVAPEYLSAFGTPTLHELRDSQMEAGEEPVIEVRVPVHARWHDLRIIGIESQATNFSDAWAYSFIFDQPFEEVRSVLNAAGFVFSKGGKQPPGNSETAPVVQLTRRANGTSLDCWF